MRRLIASAVIALLVAGPVLAQTSFPGPPEDDWTILETLDAIAAAEKIVLEEPDSVTKENVESLKRLVDFAETVLAAEDLAARARTLIVLATYRRPAESPSLDPVEDGLSASLSQPIARDTQAFRRWVNVTAAVGASALGMSAVFSAVAERNYQDWLVETDPDIAAELFRSWQGYDYIGLILGSATLVSVGVGMPLAYSLTPPTTALATPPETTVFTAESRDAELERLYGERARIVNRLNRLNQRGNLPAIFKAVSLTTGAVGSVAAATFYYLGDQTYDRYLAATDPTAAAELSEQVSAYDGLAALSGIAGGSGFALASTLGILTPGRARLERDLERVNASILRVRASRTIEIPTPAPDLEEQTGEEGE